MPVTVNHTSPQRCNHLSSIAISVHIPCIAKATRSLTRNIRICTIFLRSVFLLVLSTLPLAFTAQAASSYHNAVQLNVDSITIDADQVPLQSILRQLVERGIVVNADPTINPPVSLHLQSVSLAEAVKALLRPVNHSVIWEENSEGGVYPLQVEVYAPGKRTNMQPMESLQLFQTTTHPETGALLVAGELLVKKKAAASAARFHNQMRDIGGRILEAYSATATYRVRFSADADIDRLVATTSALDSVQLVEPHYALTLPETVGQPVLPAGSTGRETSPTAQAVAVLDSGIATEMLANQWVASSYDAVTPFAHALDTSGHGTQMALIASGSVDPLGITGQGATSPVVAIRIFDRNGITSTFSVLRALDHAQANHARVVSMSWGTPAQSTFLQQAVQQAEQQDLILVAAAGNDPTGEPIYPAAYASVIGVGALQPDGTPWESSNFGAFVEVHAPGFAAFTLQDSSQSALHAGTSIATAYVAHTIAQFLDRQPHAPVAEVRTMLRSRFSSPRSLQSR